MNQILIRLFYILTIFAFVASCSNAPDQPGGFDRGPTNTKLDPQGDTIKNNVKVISDIKAEEIPGGYIAEAGSPEFDAIVKKNSEQPIVYGIGAAGITLNTTFEDSKQTLARPAYGPDNAGQAQYSEEVIIQWRTQGVRTPYFILTLPGYKGKIQIIKESGGVTQPIGMTDEFTSYMGSNPRAGADRLAIDMYKAMTGSDSNCIEDNVCTVDWGEEFRNFYLITFPGLIVRLSKDRFSMFISLVQKTIPQGPLANDFDLFDANFLVDGEAPISLGDTFENVDGRLLAADASLEDIEIAVNTNFFGRGYSGIYLLYQKTDFSRESLKPQPSDLLLGVQLYDQYRQNFLVNKKPVFIVETPDSVYLTDTPSTDLVGARVKPLQTKINLLPSNIKSFTVQLVDYLKKAAEQKFPVATGSVSGVHQIKTIKEYSGQVVGYDPATKKGVYISFSTSEETGNLNSFVVLLIDERIQAYDQLVVPMADENSPLKKAVVEVPMVDNAGVPTGGTIQRKLPAYTELSGVRLNDLVVISDKDVLARQEATLSFVSPALDFAVNSATDFNGVLNKQERAYYNDIGEIYLPGENNNLVPRNQQFTSVSSFGITLGLTPVGEQDGVTYARVSSVTSSFLNGEIQDLCGLQFFKPKFHMKDSVFLEELRKFIKSENKSCNHFFTYDDTSNKVIASVYFPDDHIRLSFGDRELLQAMIYLPESEVLPLNSEGGAQ